MRVLWFAITPGCFHVVNTGSWIEALQRIFMKYLPNVDLGICFEYSESGKKKEDGVSYYPISIGDKSSSPRTRIEKLMPHFINVVDDFKPDIIHCFGTERWHYGLLAAKVNVPVVIHMMGNINIYDFMEEQAIHKLDYWKYFRYNPLKVFLHRKSFSIEKENRELEMEVMACNNYFMGRTDWDKNIVKYYGKSDAKYFPCPEAIRDEIYSSDLKWYYKPHDKIRLITIGNAGSLKGNEIMLKTASLLKNHFHVDFEWRYTSDAYKMSFFENLSDIRCQDVNIKLIGRLNASQIAEELAEADFYVHTSIIDNSPNSLCEAQLIGTPVIAANVGGIPQLVENGTSGFLYPYNEVHTLAFKIMNLYKQKDLLEKISRNERETSHKRHDPVLLAKRIVDIYTNIIQRHNAK